MLSFREADIFDSLKRHHDPCSEFRPIVQKLGNDQYNIIVEYLKYDTANPGMTMKKLIKDHFNQDDYQFIKECNLDGIIGWLSNHGLNKLNEMRLAWGLRTHDGRIMMFSGKKIRDFVKLKIEEEGSFLLYGPDENTYMNEQYFGMTSSQTANITDFNFLYFEILNRTGAGMPFVVCSIDGNIATPGQDA